MKKNVKIISLVVSMLLLIGAVIGISAFADSTPTIEIASKNISYEGAVKTLYAVKTENADGLTVKVNFYDTDPAKGGELLYSKGISGQITVGEETFDTVFSEGFRPKDLRNSIFVVPTLVDAGGAVVATGETVEYSPYIYAMNRFSQSATADQLNLYTALLDYGAAVQRVLSTAEEIAACGGYADEYYAITVNSALATNLAEKTVTIKGTFSKAELEAGAVSVAATLDDVDFGAWADVDGNAIRLATAESSTTLAASHVKPGRTTLTALYGGYAALNDKSCDFTNGASWHFIEVTQNIATTSENIGVKLVDENHPGTSSLIAEEGKLVYNKVSTPKEEFGDDQELWGGCNYQWWQVWFNGAVSDVLSAELDVTFNNVTGTGNFQLAMTDTLPRLYISPSAEKDENGYSTYLTAGTAKLLAGETYNLRVDWNIVTCTLNAFVDGELVYTVTNTSKAGHNHFNAFKFVADAGLSANMIFDNVATSNLCVHTEVYTDSLSAAAAGGNGKLHNVCVECGKADTSYTYDANNRGNGEYYNNTELAGTRYDMSAIPSREYHRPATQTWAINDGALSITSHDWAPMSIRPLEGTMTAVTGQKYVIEFDIMYSGSDNTGDGNHYVFSGLAGVETCSNTSQSPTFYWYSTYNDYMTLAKNDVNIANGVWYNFRYEYTVNADGSASYVTYVNNEAIDSLTGKVDAAIATCYGWSICGRVCGNGTVNLDNMYLGVVCIEHNYVVDKHDAAYYVGNGEFNEICTSCGKVGNKVTITSGNGAYFNNENALGEKADIDNTDISYRDVTTESGLAITKENGTLHLVSSAYDVITMSPGGKGIVPLPGETVIVEFDYRYEGRVKNGTEDAYGFFGLAGTSLASNGNFADTKYAGINFYENYSVISPLGVSGVCPKFLKDVWYNIRYEYTLNNDNTFTLKVFVDDAEAPFLERTNEVVKSAIYGISFQGRNDGGNVTTVSFDNFYMGVKAESVELGQGVYYSDASKEGHRVDFTGATAYATGAGNVFSGFRDGASQSAYSIVTEGENTLFRFTPTAWGYGCLSSNPAAGDGSNNNTQGVTVKVGDTLITEFDFKYNGTNASGTNSIALRFEFSASSVGQENNNLGAQINTNLSSNHNGIGFTSSEGVFMQKGCWYNIRFEYVVGTGGSVYVNGVNVASIGVNANDATRTTWTGLSFIPRHYCAGFDMDNVFFGVIPAAE